MNPDWLRPSGVKHLEPWCMCGTDALQMLSRMPLLINCGMGPSLMSPTFESGDALLMFTYRRIKELVLVLTWRSVETTQRKERPDWGLNQGPSGTAPGALITELPGLGYT